MFTIEKKNNEWRKTAEQTFDGTFHSQVSQIECIAKINQQTFAEKYKFAACTAVDEFALVFFV